MASPGVNSSAEILKVLKFDYFKQVSVVEEMVAYSLLFCFIAFVIYRLNKHLAREKDKTTARLKQDFKEKEKLAFQTLINNLKLSPQEYQLLEKISGSSTIRKNYSIIESAKRFEFRVEQFKQTQASEKILTQIFHLRHKLGFHYKNPQAPFVSTQMLTNEAKLECSIQLGPKEILFISPIVSITEKYIYIKPPTNHQKPVHLKSIAKLTCKLRRQDGLYEFQLPLIKQVFGRQNHLVLGHSNLIRKIIDREFERIPVHLLSSLYKLAGRQVNLPKKQLQALKDEETLPFLDGKIVDLSGGGFHFIASAQQQNFWERDFVMLEIPGVNTQYDFQAQILEVSKVQGKFRLHLQFFHLSDVERLKLNKLLLRLKSNQQVRQQNPVVAHPSLK